VPQIPGQAEKFASDICRYCLKCIFICVVYICAKEVGYMMPGIYLSVVLLVSRIMKEVAGIFG